MRYTKNSLKPKRNIPFQTLLMDFRQIRTVCLNLLCLGLLVACSSSDDDLLSGQAVPNGLAPLTAEQIRTAFTGNSVYSENVKQMGRTANAILYHETPGTIRMRAWGRWGKITDKGVWDVNDAGDYCAQWSGILAARGKVCFKIYKNNEQVFFVPSDTRSKSRTGTLLPGNYLDS